MEDKTINIGPKRGAKIKKRWDPKEWRPEYEAMAALAATGMPHNEIAARFGYKAPWISMIMNSPKGKIVQQLIINNIRNAASTQITTERVQKLQALAFKRVEDTLANDDIAERSPMAIFGAAMEVLKKAPVFGEADKDRPPLLPSVQNTQINYFAPGVDRKELEGSLNLANEVKQIHGPKDE
jgi:hypothetical protein